MAVENAAKRQRVAPAEPETRKDPAREARLVRGRAVERGRGPFGDLKLLFQTHPFTTSAGHVFAEPATTAAPTNPKVW